VLWHLICTPPKPSACGELVHEIGTGGENVRDRLERIMSAYEDMDRRFMAAGGLGSLLNLYEQVRRELERVSFDELDRMTFEIKNVIEALLTIDYEQYCFNVRFMVILSYLSDELQRRLAEPSRNILG